MHSTYGTYSFSCGSYSGEERRGKTPCDLLSNTTSVTGDPIGATLPCGRRIRLYVGKQIDDTSGMGLAQVGRLGQ